MSNSMGDDWIRKYLIDVGERFDGSLAKEPYRDKKKKVQLIEFLTVPRSEEDQCPVWGVISDKGHKIATRFTPEALQDYSRRQPGSSFFSAINGIITINRFRPVFTRIPLANNIRQLTRDSYFSFEVNSINVLGSQGEGVFGTPKSVEEDSEIKMWADDIRKLGGNGNVLRLRKDATQALSEPDASARPGLRGMAVSPITKQTAKKRADTSPGKHPIPLVSHPKDLMKMYRKQFRGIPDDPWALVTRTPAVVEQLGSMPDNTDIEASTSRSPGQKPPSPRIPRARRSLPKLHALDLGSSQPAMSPNHRETSLKPIGSPTASEWLPSPTGSTAMAVDDPPDGIMEPEDDLATVVKQEYTSSPLKMLSSQLSAPTPAQRQRSQPAPVFPKTSQEASSSALTATISSLVDPRPSLPLPLPNDNGGAAIKRRIPRPPQPPLPDATTTGVGRVLVPNSDTSGTVASQSQSQSQGRSEPQGSQFTFFGVLKTAEHEVDDRVVREAETSQQSAASEAALQPLVPHPLSQSKGYDGDDSSPATTRLRGGIPTRCDTPPTSQRRSVSPRVSPSKAQSPKSSIVAPQPADGDEVENSVTDESDLDDEPLQDEDHYATNEVLGEQCSDPLTDSSDEEIMDEKAPIPSAAKSVDDAQTHVMLERAMISHNTDAPQRRPGPSSDHQSSAKISRPPSPPGDATTIKRLPSQAQSSASTSDGLSSPPLEAPSPTKPPSARRSNKRKQHLLAELSKLMIEKGNALPPSFTGVPNPDFNKNTWRSLSESATAPGMLRLQGIDIDIINLWDLVQRLGGRHEVAADGWEILSLNFGLPSTILVKRQSNTESTAASGKVLKHYYEVILGKLEDACRNNVVSAERIGPPALAHTSGSTRPANMDLADSKKVLHMRSPSVPQEATPPAAHASARTHEPNEGGRKPIYLALPATQKKSSNGEGEHKPQAWAQPSFMNSRPLATRSNAPTPEAQPTKSILPLTSNTSKPSMKYRMPRPVASPSILANSAKSKPSNLESPAIVTPPIASFSRISTSTVKPARVPISTSKSGSSGLTSRGSSTSTNSNKRVRPPPSKEGSQGSHLDLAVIASAVSADKKRLVAIGRMSSAEETFIRAASMQLKRSRDSEAELPGRRVDDTSHPQKKRKIDIKVETHETTVDERQSSKPSGTAVPRQSESKPPRRKGTLLSGLRLDMRNRTEEETGPLVTMAEIDEVLLYCGKKRR